MPYSEDEEAYASQAKAEGVPKEFSRWAVSYLSGSGYDYQAYDVSAHYDPSLSFQENKAMFKQMYPSKPAEQYAKEMTNAEMDKARFDTYSSNVQMAQEERASERARKKEFVEGEIEKSKEPSELDVALEETEKPKGFFDTVSKKAGDFIEQKRLEKELKKKGEEIKTKTKAEELARQLELAQAKQKIRQAERVITKEKAEEMGYRLKGGATGEMIFQHMDFLGKAKPTSQAKPRMQFLESRRQESDDSLRRSLDISVRQDQPRSPRARASQGLDLDMFSQRRQPGQRASAADRLGLDVYGSRQPQQAQKYRYRWVIEKGGVARRERIPVTDPQTGQPQYQQPQQRGSPFLASMDIFKVPGRIAERQNGGATGRFALSGPRLEQFGQGTKMDFTTKAKGGFLKNKQVQFFSKPKPQRKGKKPKKQKQRRFL